MSSTVVKLRPSNRSLDDRIADAFGADLHSQDVAALLTEVAAAEANARSASAAATARALDPKTKSADVMAARKDKEDAEFVLARMETATPKLRAMLAATERREAEKAAIEASRIAFAERDALAKELSDVYPAMAEQLADLLHRIAINNAKVGVHNGAEAVARRAPANWHLNPDGNRPSLTVGVRLPIFDLSRTNLNGFLWADGSGQSLPGAAPRQEQAGSFSSGGSLPANSPATKVSVTNLEPGNRGVNGVAGQIAIEPGDTVDVTMTEGEIASSKATRWFAFDDQVAAKNARTAEADRQAARRARAGRA